MKVKFATKTQIKNWNTLLAQKNCSIFQMTQIAKTKELRGWQTVYLMVEDLPVTIHQRSVPFFGKLWYAIKSPQVTSTEELKKAVNAISDFAKQHGVFLLKIEPELPKDLAGSLPKNWVKNRAIQPNHSTIILDTSPDTEAILKNLNQKGRHAIRRAERDGVIAKKVDYTPENAKRFYRLFEETANGRFRIRGFNYHNKFWQGFIDDGSGALFFAHHNNKLVSAAFCMKLGKKGVYKDGASIRQKTVYGASHLLQWRVIEWMNSQKIEEYDMCGSPPAKSINDKSHPHYGIGRFKTSFNKQVTEYLGVYDVAISPLKYKIWQKIGEKIWLRLYSAIKKQYWY